MRNRVQTKGESGGGSRSNSCAGERGGQGGSVAAESLEVMVMEQNCRMTFILQKYNDFECAAAKRTLLVSSLQNFNICSGAASSASVSIPPSVSTIASQQHAHCSAVSDAMFPAKSFARRNAHAQQGPFSCLFAITLPGRYSLRLLWTMSCAYKIARKHK